MTKILYVAMKHDYGMPEQGWSFEHTNFFDALHRMGYDILYFDFMTLMKQRGRAWMNQRLREVVRAEHPAMMFTVLFTDELDPTVLREISEKTDTVTLNWFCDDHWRFETFSRHWAPCFNWVTTTTETALPKYAARGYDHAIKTQWAHNPFSYRRDAGPLEHDVTFVGQPHSDRVKVIEALRRAGFRVQVWGTGWESGRLTHEEMIRVFNRSRINLNFSKASVPAFGRGSQIMGMARRWIESSRSSVSRNTRLSTIEGPRVSTCEDVLSVSKNPIQVSMDRSNTTLQIKARNFEIAGCGGFLLTEPAENLEEYYVVDEELVCFRSVGELIEKVDFYLHHEDARAAIASAGYQRTQREHTYVHRFIDIFQCIGFPTPSLDDVLQGTVPPGQINEMC